MTNGSYRSSKFLDVDPLANAQRVFDLDSQITDRAINLCVAEQKLNRLYVTSLSIDFRYLRSAHRMRAISAGTSVDACDLPATANKRTTCRPGLWCRQRHLVIGFRSSQHGSDRIGGDRHFKADAQHSFRSESIAASTRVADVRKLPYPDDSFDVVMAAHLLEHLHDPAAALQELVRVARPGGVIILCLTRRSVLGFYIHIIFGPTWVRHELDWWEQVTKIESVF